METHVEVAAVLVANAAVAVVTITAGGALASNKAKFFARVRCIGRGDGVGLPKIHLSAAGAQLSASRILVVWTRLPALRVGVAVDPLDVMRALRVAVAFCKSVKTLRDAE